MWLGIVAIFFGGALVATLWLRRTWLRAWLRKRILGRFDFLTPYRYFCFAIHDIFWRLGLVRSRVDPDNLIPGE